MAFPDTFRFSMRPTEALTQWYYWQGLTVGISGTPRYIDTPHEWKKTGSKWVRSYEMRGLKRSIAAPYQFVLDGAAILRSAYINGSIESKVYFLIEKLNDDTLEYEDFFAGEIDLSTYLDGVIFNNGRKGLSAAVIEGGISAELDAQENTPHEIELGSGSDTINMDGIKVQVGYTWGTLGSNGTQNITQTSGGPMNDRSMALYFGNREGEYSQGTSSDAVERLMAKQAFAGGSAEHNNEIYEASGLQDVVLTCRATTLTYQNANYVGGNSGAVKARINFVLWDASAASASITASIVDTGTCAVSATRTWNVPEVSFSRTLDTGDRVYLVYDVVKADLTTPTVGSWGFSYPALLDAVNISVGYRLPSTDCKAKSYFTVIQELVEKITGQAGIVSSSFFANSSYTTKDCHPANVRLTCGDALRRLTKNPAGVDTTPSLRITWAEMKKDMRCRFGLGVDVRNGQVIIEEATSFFNEAQVIAHLGEVRTFTYEPAREYFATTQKWGYSQDTSEKLNGRDDPHTVSVWKWPAIRVQKEDDNICPFITSMYAIERARANLSGKKTTDSLSDNETFAIETETTTTSGKYNLYRPQNSNSQPSQTGLLYPDTAYNLTMSPKRNLLRSGSFIRGALYNQPSRVLTFQTNDKNAEMVINLGSGAIAEKSDIVVSSLDAPAFKSVLFHVDAVTPIAMKANMDAAPDGCFKFYSEGVEYAGFPIEVGIDGDLRNAYQMTLLCTPNTDLTALISI